MSHQEQDDFFFVDAKESRDRDDSSNDSDPNNATYMNRKAGRNLSYGSISTTKPERYRKQFTGAHRNCRRSVAWVQEAAHQIPAVALVGMFHLMVGIPFGVSYFPVGWRAETSNTANSDLSDDDVHGEFPLPGKESLGIRMFLFSTLVAQIIFTFTSKFVNPIGLQMVENVPFCHALAYVVISEQGYGIEALSTLFFLFGFASVVVGVVFFLLGHLKMGKVVYYFPSHVLVGCIGGIGVFIAITGIEVTIDATVSFDNDGIDQIISNLDLLGVVVLFEILLRICGEVTKVEGKARYPLLTPIYFCMITPIFYLALWLLRVDVAKAEDAGYFFPPLDACDSLDAACENQSMFEAIFSKDLWTIWRVIDFTTISWTAVFKSIPTLVALVAFSLIHVPINIPAFAISTNVDVDMNAELVAHGYSNFIAGIVGGLQNYMAYTQSILYAKSGGEGKLSSLAVAAVTIFFFFIGPTVASYIPRCMAGTLLVHVGIDLFLEGVYDSYGKFDRIEYAGIWLITGVMTLYGMSAALVAGVISALSTYALQSITHLHPIRGYMSASTLRSSSWNRPPAANAILEDDDIGRNRILVIQLQGHLFFGNVAEFSDNIKAILAEKTGTKEEAWIVIIDFTLVLGLDSSAAQVITKLKRVMRKTFHVECAIFVSGSNEGFPTEYPLSRELSAPDLSSSGLAQQYEGEEAFHNESGEDEETLVEGKLLLRAPRRTIVQGSNRSYTLAPGSVSFNGVTVAPSYPQNHVCDSLDAALIYSEDVLIGRQDPNLLSNENDVCTALTECSLAEERETGLRYLANLCPGQNESEIQYLFSFFARETYNKDDIVWKQGASSDCAKLLVFGAFYSNLEKEAGTTEPVNAGCIIGELGLVHGMTRMSTVKCTSESAIAYSLSKESWEKLIQENPKVARFIDLIVVRYLAQRVCHVSNRIFETRCLPV